MFVFYTLVVAILMIISFTVFISFRLFIKGARDQKNLNNRIYDKDFNKIEHKDHDYIG